ncbi:unnamed protein product [Symbiodinium necroappetens]|uniref:Uncharacterized protein n=1 Tax=Symbiodinium necroappetens TaxID=1628268 RepID=A0A812WLP7_9DINO|nr:unnamed protein product [Symbiodinium necroappetens]
MQHRSSMVRRRCLASFCLVLFAAFSQSSFSFINLGLNLPGRIKALVARGAGEGAILSCDTREDFVANLNGSLTVAMFSSSMCGPCFLMEPKARSEKERRLSASCQLWVSASGFRL